MKKAILQFSLIAIGVVFCGSLSSSEFDTMKQDDIQYSQMNGSIIDMDNNGVHDSVCMCGYCTEPYEDFYTLKLGLCDSANYQIFMCNQEGDTIADLSNNKQLHTIIDEDNL